MFSNPGTAVEAGTFSKEVREAVFFAAVQPDLLKFDPAIGKTNKFHTVIVLMAY